MDHEIATTLQTGSTLLCNALIGRKSPKAEAEATCLKLSRFAEAAPVGPEKDALQKTAGCLRTILDTGALRVQDAHRAMVAVAAVLPPQLTPGED